MLSPTCKFSMYNKQIETFISVADCGSFSKAADKLFISTVAVAKQINSLENSIGIKLLDRTNHGVALTSAGHSIYQDAKEIIRISDESIRKAKLIDRAENYPIRIGSSTLYPYQVILHLLYEIGSTLPFQLDIVPFSDETSELSTALNVLGKEYDCLVAPIDSNLLDGNFSVLHLQPQPYRIAVPRTHRLSNKKSLTLEDLHGDKLLFLERGILSHIDDLRNMLEQEHPEIELINFHQTYNISVFNECVHRNCPMVSLDIWADIHPFMVTLPVDWNCEAQIGIIYSKSPSNRIKDFIGCLNDRKSE